MRESEKIHENRPHVFFLIKLIKNEDYIKY